jgi:F-type H+-transporting ATPase subunit epsilon
MSDAPQPLSVIARAPFHVYFEGEAEVVTATNRIGEFDVLPGHADFFSMLTPGEVIVGTSGEPVAFTIRNGIMTVRDNKVMIFVNI